MTVAATYRWPVMRIHSKIWVTIYNVPYHGLSKSQPTNPFFDCICSDIKNSGKEVCGPPKYGMRGHLPIWNA